MALSDAPEFASVEHGAPGERLALHRREEPNGSRSPVDTADYAELRQLVLQSGLLERQPAYYVAKFTGTALMLGLGLLVLVRAASLPAWVQFLNVVYLAFVFGQIGLLGHDVAHRQVFRSARLASLFGIVLGNLLLGIGLGWWRES